MNYNLKDRISCLFFDKRKSLSYNRKLLEVECMKVKLENLELESFICNNIDHFIFREELASDQSIKEYLKNIRARLQELPEKVTTLQYRTSYIVKDHDQLVGYVHLEEIESNSLELHYAVHPNYRGNGYGVQILNEVGKYLLEYDDNIKFLKLYIDPHNVVSKRCAQEAGYQYQKEKHYYYRKNKKE